MAGRVTENPITFELPDANGHSIVFGVRNFYVPDTGWIEKGPGAFGVSKLKFAAGAAGNSHNASAVIPNVEFYYFEPSGLTNKNFVALNGDKQDYFAVAFFGTKYGL